MNLEKFTIKSQQVEEAQTLAVLNQNQQIEITHLMTAMLEKDENVIPFLLKKMNVNLPLLKQMLDKQLASLPKVIGGSPQYLSTNANMCIQKSLMYMKEMGDEFVSLEHLLMGILESGDVVSSILKDQGVTLSGLKMAIQELRKGSKVNSRLQKIPIIHCRNLPGI